MSHLISKLPAGLSDPVNMGKVRLAVTQWSKTVPWIWSSYLVFAKKDLDKAKEEKKLKKFFSQILQTQAQNLSAFTAYGLEESKEVADTNSKIFKYLLGGNHAEIKKLQPDFELQLTLSDVLKELTNEECIFKSDPAFLDMFSFEVSVDSYSGTIREELDDTGKPIPGKYISVMVFPPPPPFSEVTVTEEQLIDWITKDGGYLPPSAFLVLSGC